MQFVDLALILAASVAFVAAAGTAKFYALYAAWYWLVGALVLYSVGNLLVIMAMRRTGLGLAMSVSTVVQLVLINVLAFCVFREELSWPQYAGIGLAMIAVGLMVLFPAGSRG